jgi:hypothetical protein
MCIMVQVGSREYFKTSRTLERVQVSRRCEIGRQILLIGKHISVAIFDAPNEEAILKITYPFRELGVPHIAPALPLEEALEMMEKM